MRVIGADIGGTKSNLGIFEGDDPDSLEYKAGERYGSQDAGSLNALLRRFLADAGTRAEDIDAVGIGIAGAIVGDTVDSPNLPWPKPSRKGCMEELGLKSLVFVNDLEATAYGVPILWADQLVTIQDVQPQEGRNQALIAAGTGLGQATMFAQGGHHVPSASEGGHCDYAPQDELEIGLLRYLMRHYQDHVSVERVVSGPGLFNIYKYLRQQGEHGEESPELAQELDGPADPSAAVASAGAAGDRLAAKALERFMIAYGAEAGNLALKSMALGGLYVGGGIAPKLIEQIKAGAFLDAFRRKGRYADLMAQMPVYVILEPKTALFGAARAAALKR